MEQKTLTGSNATSNSFNLNENEIVTCVFNDSLRTGTVTGDKYKDTNANGVDNGATDPPIEGWNIYLFSDSNRRCPRPDRVQRSGGDGPLYFHGCLGQLHVLKRGRR